jgi:hypothetical protein
MTGHHVLSRRSKTLTQKRETDASDIFQGGGAACATTGHDAFHRDGLRLGSVLVKCKDGSRLLEI